MRRPVLTASTFLAVLMALALAPITLAAHPILRGGTGAIPVTAAVPGHAYGWADVDAGELECTGPCIPSADIVFHVKSSPTVRYLESEIGIKRMGSKPGYSTCASATLTPGAFKVGRNIGRWFCLKTGEGRYARVRINGYGTAKVDYVMITGSVWCKLGDPC